MQWASVACTASFVRPLPSLCCREVQGAARIVGNPSLFRLMEQASAAIKRDIVFATSLYLT